MYKSRSVKAHSWNWVVNEFAEYVSVNPECEPMHRLISQIASSHYAGALFPQMSMHTLKIFQTPRFDNVSEVLRIDFDCSQQRFYFEYAERPFVSSVERNWEQPRPGGKNWTKECGADNGFDAFKRFLELKKWFI